MCVRVCACVRVRLCARVCVIPWSCVARARARMSPGRLCCPAPGPCPQPPAAGPGRCRAGLLGPGHWPPRPPLAGQDGAGAEPALKQVRNPGPCAPAQRPCTAPPRTRVGQSRAGLGRAPVPGASPAATRGDLSLGASPQPESRQSSRAAPPARAQPPRSAARGGPGPALPGQRAESARAHAHTCMHAHNRVHSHPYTHTRNTCIHTHSYTHTRTCMQSTRIFGRTEGHANRSRHSPIHAHTCTTQTYLHAYTSTRVHSHSHLYTQTHTHVCTHTHTHYSHIHI